MKNFWPPSFCKFHKNFDPNSNIFRPSNYSIPFHIFNAIYICAIFHQKKFYSLSPFLSALIHCDHRPPSFYYFSNKSLWFLQNYRVAGVWHFFSRYGWVMGLICFRWGLIHHKGGFPSIIEALLKKNSVSKSFLNYWSINWSFACHLQLGFDA